MKKLILLPILAVLLLTPFVSAQDADNEEIQRLNDKVAMLSERVDALTMEVARLRAEIAAMKTGTPAATPEAVRPKIGDIFGGSGGKIAGTYAVDTAHLEKVMLEMTMKQIAPMLEDVSPEEREGTLAMVKAQIKQQAASMKLDFNLKPDSTFSVQGEMGGMNIDAGGTWKRDGERLELTTTHEDGEAKAEPETKSARIVGDVITIEKDEDLPFDLILRKK